MYGFVAYVVSTVVLVFGYTSSPASATPFIWLFLWVVGAIIVCVGGYWFWFFIRADVSAEGQSPFRLMRAESARHWERVEQDKALAVRWPEMDSCDYELTLYMTTPGTEAS